MIAVQYDLLVVHRHCRFDKGRRRTIARTRLNDPTAVSKVRDECQDEGSKVFHRNMSTNKHVECSDDGQNAVELR